MYLRTIPLFFVCGYTFCQSTIATTGGDVASPTGNVSFTVGQIDYVSVESSGSVNQGVQQPYELFVLETTEWTSDFVISAYPNPIVSFLTINIGETTPELLDYVLTDENGRIVSEGMLKEKETKLDVRELASSTYFLNILHNDQQVKTYKLIKRIE